MKYIYLIVLVLLVGRHTAFAQILNVEKNRLKSDSADYFLGSIGVDFNINNRSMNDDGETTTFIGLTASSNVGYVTKQHLLLLISQFQYNAVTNKPINSTGFGHFRINFLRKRKLSYETYTQLQYDQGRGMQLRWLGGGGIRYRFYDHEKSSLYIGIGAFREREVWEFPTNEDRIRIVNIWKSSNYLASRVKLNEQVDFNFIMYYQTGYDFVSEFFRHRISTDANLLISITSKLAFKASVNAAYENRPVVPITKLVFSATNGILVNF